MPWTTQRYPPAMEHLPPEVRQKAIDVANAVLSEHGDEGTAIRIGIARAKAWARRLDIDAGGDDDGDANGEGEGEGDAATAPKVLLLRRRR